MRITIFNSPDVRRSIPDCEWATAHSSFREWKTWEQNVVDFFRSHRGADYSLSSPTTHSAEFNAQIKFIVRLYFCLAKFVSFYPTFTRSHAPGTRLNFPPTTPDKRSRLTSTERLRLQRGLLRYELCCRLVGIPSVAAYQNRQVFTMIMRSETELPAEHYDIWLGNPFTRFLPMDEVEEIICASEYVDGLYNNLHCSFVEDFQNAILDFSQIRNEDEEARDKDISDLEKITVRDWLSDDRLEHYHLLSKWFEGGFGSRLGLVFLDRVARSTPTDRREFMRGAFHTFDQLHTSLPMHYDNFLRPSWHNVLSRRGGLLRNGTVSLEVGPHCNPILQTSLTHHATTRLLTTHGSNYLRRLGWVFFDDQTTLRSLGIPHDGKVSSIHDWVMKKHENPLSVLTAKISDSALAARFTEDEWKDLFMDKYSPKIYDSQAMSRFVAGARAVVNFISDKLPQVD